MFTLLGLKQQWMRFFLWDDESEVIHGADTCNLYTSKSQGQQTSG